MDRSIRSRTSSTSSLRSPAAPSTPAPTPSLGIPVGTGTPRGHRVPSPDQLAASLSRLRAERAQLQPATPAPTPSPANPHPDHSLLPEQLQDSLYQLGGGDEGIASGSVPSTPAATPFSPSPSVNMHITSDQIAASIARLRDSCLSEGGSSLAATQPCTPSSTPAYPPVLGGVGGGGAQHLGVIPEHLAEGMNFILQRGHGGDEGLESGSAPCTPTPTPFSPSPAQHTSLLAEQLAAGISRLKVEEGMSSGGSTGLPATPAPTPFSLGPGGGIRPEDLVAGISRLSVIQEMETGPSIAVHEASVNELANSSLSNYFGTPQSSGDSVFDTLATPSGKGNRSRYIST